MIDAVQYSYVCITMITAMAFAILFKSNSQNPDLDEYEKIFFRYYKKIQRSEDIENSYKIFVERYYRSIKYYKNIRYKFLIMLLFICAFIVQLFLLTSKIINHYEASLLFAIFFNVFTSTLLIINMENMHICKKYIKKVIIAHEEALLIYKSLLK